MTDLLNNYTVVERFKVKAASLVGRGKSTAGQAYDIERMLSKVYSYSVRAQV